MSKSSNLKFYLKIVCLYLIVGFVFTYPSIQRAMAKKEVQAIPETKTVEVIEGNPVKLTIPVLNIELAIAGGNYNKTSKAWDLSPTKALFAEVTVKPNTKEGNTLIYGHNTNAVFYPLRKLTIGDEVIIYTDNNHIFVYKLESSEVVSPNDTRIFEYQGSPRLTLQTCSNIFSTQRKLYYFNLEKAD